MIRSNPLEIGLFASAAVCESSETRSSFYYGSGTCKTKLYEKSFDPDRYTHGKWIAQNLIKRGWKKHVE